ARTRPSSQRASSSRDRRGGPPAGVDPGLSGLVRRRGRRAPGRGRAAPMTRPPLNLALVLALAAAGALAVTLGEAALSLDQYAEAFVRPAAPAGEILWPVRAPRVVLAALVGAALGLAGALLQGLLRNPLADPGVLGVSASAALGAALAIVAGLALTPGAVEVAAWIGAAGAGLALVAFSARFPEPEALILFGVALSSFAGAVTALVFNLSPSPIATAEVMAWLL